MKLKFLYSLSLNLVFGLLILTSCGSDKTSSLTSASTPVTPASTPEEVIWAFEKDAIFLKISSAENLNYANNQAHAVSLCVYQTPNANAIQSLAETVDGIKQLLQCTSVSPDRLHATQLYIQPNTTLEKTLDRVETAKHVAFIVGYNQLSTENSFAIIPIPVHTDKERNMFLKKIMTYLPAKLDVMIDLSSEKINLQGVERVQK